MSQRRSPEHRDLLGEALSAFDQETARQQAQQRRQVDQSRSETQPCPPDPELDALFKDFAQRMPQSTAVPFVAEETTEHSVSALRKFLAGTRIDIQSMSRGIPSSETRERLIDKRLEGHSKTYSQQQITRGWRIGAKSVSGFVQLTMPSKGDPETIWSGLAVDLEGNLWFARDAFKPGKGTTKIAELWPQDLDISWSAFTSSAVAISGMHKTMSGTETVPQLGRPTGRNLRDAILRFCSLSGNADDLPELIAQGMAKTIRGK